jgi:RNA polymerase primary sigma factor
MQKDAMRAEALTEALAALTPREALVLRMRHGLDGEGERTLEEIGGVLGVTRERVRQIEMGARKKLAKYLRARE